MRKKTRELRYAFGAVCLTGVLLAAGCGSDEASDGSSRTGAPPSASRSTGSEDEVRAFFDRTFTKIQPETGQVRLERAPGDKSFFYAVGVQGWVSGARVIPAGGSFGYDGSNATRFTVTKVEKKAITVSYEGTKVGKGEISIAAK